jgi:predicted TIM-barrel fold metal-dependent hydrolase
MSRKNIVTPTFDRRDFLKGSLLPATALPLLSSRAVHAAATQEQQPTPAAPPGIVDTNVHLFDWPFRRLKYAQTTALLAKLKKHRITQAWAGTFQALLHKNLDAANARLTDECRRHGEGFFIPMGSVNPVWPDWEEDLRRCHEVHHMNGIRLYPNFHSYRLDRPEFARLLELATARGLLVQIVIEMEDERVHHPIVTLPPVDAAPLAAVLKDVPQTRVQLLNGLTALQRGGSALAQETSVVFDIANLEGTGAVGRLIEGKHGSIRTQVPASRLLFGSHAPYFPCEAALLRLFESPLEKDQLLPIMRDNAQRLLASAGR